MRKKRFPATVHNIPPKNYPILFIVFSQFLVVLPLFKWIIKRYLVHCYNINFSPGFKFLYGNIYAKNVEFGSTFFVDYAPIYIGDNSGFGFENMVITSKHKPFDRDVMVMEPVHIGKNVLITSRCIILQGVTIGDNSIIAAGSVVTHDIPANCLAGGSPARPIKYFGRKYDHNEKK
jgi:acetyltransferase-like isoleucine patch superfamily enzyme